MKHPEKTTGHGHRKNPGQSQKEVDELKGKVAQLEAAAGGAEASPGSELAVARDQLRRAEEQASADLEEQRDKKPGESKKSGK